MQTYGDFLIDQAFRRVEAETARERADLEERLEIDALFLEHLKTTGELPPEALVDPIFN